MDLNNHITSIVDFPQKGIIFRDITPLIGNPESFKYTIDSIAAFGKENGANVVVGPDARGFIFGCPVAYALNTGFVPVRKPGKLPRETIDESYDLEYGSNTLSMHKDALKKGDKVLIVDDLLATGGTVEATIKMVERLGAEVVGIAFVIELVDLGGKNKLKNIPYLSLLKY